MKVEPRQAEAVSKLKKKVIKRYTRDICVFYSVEAMLLQKYK